MPPGGRSKQRRTAGSRGLLNAACPRLHPPRSTPPRASAAGFTRHPDDGAFTERDAAGLRMLSMSSDRWVFASNTPTVFIVPVYHSHRSGYADRLRALT